MKTEQQIRGKIQMLKRIYQSQMEIMAGQLDDCMLTDKYEFGIKLLEWVIDESVCD